MSTLRTDTLQSLDGTVSKNVKLLLEETSQNFLLFDTVADMKESSELYVGMKAKTLGYNTVNDGGGAFYDIVPKGTGVVDGGSVISLPVSNLQALAAFSSVVSVKQFGVAENITDNSDKLQRAIDYSDALYVPKGEYVVNKQILLKSDFTLYGEGTIKASPSPLFIDGTNIYHYALLHGTDLFNVEITGITIDTSDVLAVPDNAFSMRALLFLRCDNIDIYKCKFNVNGGATAILGCNNYRVSENNVNVNLMTGETDGVLDNWSEGGTLFSATLSNNYIEGNNVARWGILFNGVEFKQNTWTIENILVSENVIENCSLDGIWLGGREPTINGFSVTNNKIFNSLKGISLSSCLNGTVQGNVIKDCVSTGILLWKEGEHPGSIGCRYTTISDNIIKKEVGTTAGAAIEIAGDTSLNNIQNNIVWGPGYEFGYLVGVGPVRNIISPKITDGVVSRIFSDGTQNIITSNQYAPTITPLDNFNTANLISSDYQVDGLVVTVYFIVAASAGVAGNLSRFSISIPVSFKVGLIAGSASTAAFTATIEDSGETADVVCFPTTTDSFNYSGSFSYRISI